MLAVMDEDVLHIAEIHYDSGEVRFRYMRQMSEDGSKWIRHGLFVEYSTSGQVLCEGDYVDGMENGLWRDYHENGQLAAEGRYRAGKKHGVWRFWADDGSPEDDEVYED